MGRTGKSIRADQRRFRRLGYGNGRRFGWHERRSGKGARKLWQTFHDAGRPAAIPAQRRHIRGSREQRYICSAWRSAIDGDADWVQIVTWSDFSESSEIEPYTDATLRSDIGTGFYDLNAYYAAWFLSGKRPSITHDVLYYFYRREPSSAASPSQGTFRRVGNTPAEDEIELLAFLTAPGAITVSIGGHDFTQNAPAGITSFKVPLQPGTPEFSVARGGSTVFSFQAPVQIFGQEGLPSGLFDMTYWSGSASKDGICSL